MEVSRLYEVHKQFYVIERLWAVETVFSDTPSEKGRKETLERLIVLRDDLNKVIAELEDEAWLL